MEGDEGKEYREGSVSKPYLLTQRRLWW